MTNIHQGSGISPFVAGMLTAIFGVVIFFTIGARLLLGAAFYFEAYPPFCPPTDSVCVAWDIENGCTQRERVPNSDCRAWSERVVGPAVIMGVVLGSFALSGMIVWGAARVFSQKKKK